MVQKWTSGDARFRLAIDVDWDRLAHAANDLGSLMQSSSILHHWVDLGQYHYLNHG